MHPQKQIVPFVFPLIVVLLLVVSVPAECSELRVATFNVQTVGGSSSSEYLALSSVIERMCPDVLLVQEIYQSSDVADFLELASTIGYEYTAYSDVSGTMAGGLRNGCMSIFPILSYVSWSSAEISGDPDANDITRDIFQVRLDLPGQRELGAFTLHLKSSSTAPDQFRRQVELTRVTQVLDSYRTAHPDDYIVITGDFNEDYGDGPFGSPTWNSVPSTVPSSYQLGSDISLPITYDPFELLLDQGLVFCDATWEDSSSNHTTRPASGRRLDYVFYDSTGLTLVDDEVYYSTQDNGVDDLPPGNWIAKCGSIPGASVSLAASDHLTVVADFSYSAGTPVPTATPAPTATPEPTATATPLELVSIYDIQYTVDPGGASPYANQTLTTEGVVTAVDPSNNYNFIQDGTGAWNGLKLYQPPVSLTVGDWVRVTGQITEYYGMTEMSPIDSVTVLSSGQTLPLAVEMSSAAVNDESWEGVLVRVRDVTVTNADAGYGEWEVDDGSGMCRVDDVFSYDYLPVLNDLLTGVRGPVEYTFEFYKIEPRDNGDIWFGPDPTMTPTVEPTITPTVMPSDGILTGQVAFERPGVSAPHESWQMPLVITLCDAGMPSEEYTLVTENDGSFSMEVAAGTFNVMVKNAHTLARRLNMVTVPAGGSTQGLDFGLLLEGDATGDNQVTSEDFFLLRGAYNTAPGDPGFDARCDFNADDAVTSTDFFLMRGNYNIAGPSCADDKWGEFEKIDR